MEQLSACVKAIQKKTDFVPEIGIVLGSGLGEFASMIDIVSTISYSEIENFPVSTVDSHVGRYVFGYIESVPVVCMQGRVHYYEGYSIEEVVLPIRIMKLLGAQKLLLTNASGGINEHFHPGDFMMLTGHISLFIPNPLIGENSGELGERFPSMDQVYSERLQNCIREVSEEQQIPIREGVYVQLTGPSFESPDEIRFLRTVGADAVGMSTVCEAISAKHMGMEIAGISCISNLAAGMSEEELTVADVDETTNRVGGTFNRLVREMVIRFGGLK